MQSSGGGGGGGGMLSGMASTMVQGFAFGTGSALAREAVGSVFGGSKATAPESAAPAPMAPSIATKPMACDFDQKQFMSCLQANPTSSGVCDHYYNALQSCQQHSM
mmetsp:Transcript_31930/g.70351  ORF Transcript_31930/g.70351 Transcript_31930/m.70351 type:complete len:106 (-) Transcript_31930:158-475(-)